MHTKNKLSILETIVSTLSIIIILGILLAIRKHYKLEHKLYSIIFVFLSFFIVILVVGFWKKIYFFPFLTFNRLNTSVFWITICIAFVLPIILFFLDMITWRLNQDTLYTNKFIGNKIYTNLYILKYIILLPILISIFSVGQILSELKNNYSVLVYSIVFSIIFIGLSLFFERFFVYTLYDIVAYVVLSFLIRKIFIKTNSLIAAWIIYLMYIVSATYIPSVVFVCN